MDRKLIDFLLKSFRIIFLLKLKCARITTQILEHFCFCRSKFFHIIQTLLKEQCQKKKYRYEIRGKRKKKNSNKVVKRKMKGKWRITKSKHHREEMSSYKLFIWVKKKFDVLSLVYCVSWEGFVLCNCSQLFFLSFSMHFPNNIIT